MPLKIGLILIGLALSYPLQADPVITTELRYEITEPSGEQYISRYLIHADYLRIDDPGSVDGFVLYDRRKGFIYSVDAEAKRILVMQPSDTSGKSTTDPVFQLEQEIMKGAPRIAGIKPQSWVFLIHGELCQHAVVLPDFMTEQRQIYAEFLTTLGEVQGDSQVVLPGNKLSQCDAAIHVEDPASVLRQGLPVEIQDIFGRRQTLIDFKQQAETDIGLFELPSNYQQQPFGVIE